MASPTINLNDLIPAPDVNFENVKWKSAVSVHGPGITNVSAEVPLMTPSGTGHQGGLVPDPGGSSGSSKFLCEDGTWATPGGGGGGSLLFQMDGDSLSGYTTNGTVAAGQATSGFAPGDFNESVKLGDLPGTGDAEINSAISSFANTTIEFDVAAIHDVTFTIPIVHVIFGANSTGAGPAFRLDGRGSGNFSGMATAAVWSNVGAPTAGLNLTTSTWYHVKIVMNATGTQATVIINGQVVNQTAITLNGVWVGFNASNGNTGGYVANFRVYAS